MKYSFLTIALFCFAIICFGQNRIADERAINGQMDAFIRSWNHHDFTDVDKYTTEDVVFVNPLGMLWKGRKEFQYAMTSFHKGILKDANIRKQSSEIRFITNDVAIVHLISHIGSFKAWDNKSVGSNEDAETYVFVKRNDKWLLTAGQAIGIDAGAAQYNPVKAMPKQYQP